MAAQDVLRDLINAHFYKGDTFLLKEAYRLFEADMQDAYPDNSKIREKIRQMLQKLRGFSFLEFINNNGLYRVVGNSARPRPSEQSYRPDNIPPEELDERELLEGACSQITVNAYERNIKARTACIEQLGCWCSVCGFDFEQHYGEYG